MANIMCDWKNFAMSLLFCQCYLRHPFSLSLSRALLRCSISCSFAVMSIYLWIIETCLFYLLLSLVLLPYAILNICVVILYLTLFLLQMTKFSFIRFTRICFKRILFRRDQSEGKKNEFSMNAILAPSFALNFTMSMKVYPHHVEI